MTQYRDYAQMWSVLKFGLRETNQALACEEDKDILAAILELMDFMETTTITQNDMRVVVKQAFPDSADKVSSTWEHGLEPKD